MKKSNSHTQSKIGVSESTTITISTHLKERNRYVNAPSNSSTPLKVLLFSFHTHQNKHRRVILQNSFILSHKTTMPSKQLFLKPFKESPPSYPKREDNKNHKLLT